MIRKQLRPDQTGLAAPPPNILRDAQNRHTFRTDLMVRAARIQALTFRSFPRSGPLSRFSATQIRTPLSLTFFLFHIYFIFYVLIKNKMKTNNA